MNKPLKNVYIQLFHILPRDIVFYIYIILKQEAANKILINFYRKRKLKFGCMNNFIKNILFDNTYSEDNNHLFKTVSNENIKNIEVILQNHYKSYNMQFWQNILSIMSKNIMKTNNNYSLSMHYKFIDKNNINYLKKIISLWFALCQKFNISLKYTYKKNNNSNNLIYQTVISRAKNLTFKSFKNFDKFLYSPNIIYTCNDWYYDDNNFQYFDTIIDNDIAYRYLIRTLY